MEESVHAAEWPHTSLGALIDGGDAELQTGPFGTMLHASAYSSSGVPVVAVKHIGDNQLSHDGLPRIDGLDADRLDRYRLQEGDILFARKGSVDRRALVKADEADWIQGSDCIRLRLRPTAMHPRFASYVLGTSAHRDWILQHAHGATMPSLNQEILRLIPLPIPPLAEQHRIAEILGALDDKIELNRRMNGTLESIARAIFKSWFVDFDPVRKKMEGGEVRLPSGAACFFPGEFRESPVGLIPNDWECRPLGDVAQFTTGRSYKSAELGPSETALVTLKSFSRGGGYRDDGLKDYVGPYRPEQVVDAGDVLVAHTDVTQAAEVLGRAVRVRSSSRHKTLVASLDTVVVRPTGDHLTREFLFLALDNDRFRDHAYGYSNGTTVLHLGAKALPEFLLVVPPAGLVATFSEIAESLLARADLLGEENAFLAAVRDRLLPELMAGRLPSRRTAVVAGRTEASAARSSASYLLTTSLQAASSRRTATGPARC